MLTLSCGWCFSDDTGNLIAGTRAYICRDCVVVCNAEIAKNLPVVADTDKRRSCSFCGQKQSALEKKLVPGNGYYICSHCLDSCNLVIEDTRDDLKAHKSKASKRTEKPKRRVRCDCGEFVHSPLTDAGEEWRDLDLKRMSEQEFLNWGRKWLKRNSTDPSAARVILRIAAVKTSSKLIEWANEWLSVYPNDHSSPDIVAFLLNHSPSRKLVRQAGVFLDRSGRLYPVEKIVDFVIKGGGPPSLLRKVEALLERTYKDSGWVWALFKRHNKSKFLDVRYLELNVDNPKVFPLDFIFSQHPATLEALFKWMQNGGRRSEYTSGAISHVLRYSSYYNPARLPEVLAFARQWISSHPSDEHMGDIIGQIISITQSEKDIEYAKQWYLSNKDHKSAWFILANLLDLSAHYGLKPDAFAIEHSKLFLRDPKKQKRMEWLKSSLVVAHPDEETIAWCFDEYQRSRNSLLLKDLIRAAPTDSLIMEAHKTSAKWRDPYLEPYMLIALLQADPRNRRSRLLAHQWLKCTPRHPFRKPIHALLDRL
jgi:hypothetical protein